MGPVSRRAAIAMGLGAIAAGCAGEKGRGAAQSLQISPAASSLDAIAARTGRRFGSAVGGGAPGTRTGSYADSRYRDIIVAECGVIVPENELKWGAIRPSYERFEWAGGDRLADFAAQNHLAMRGHTLLWHHPRWLPRWLDEHDFGANPAAASERMITQHVRAVCARYGRRIHSYDVVNEAVDNSTGGMRETAFSRHLTAQGAVDLAFHAARDAAPHAQLVYNDYMDWTAWGAPHRTGVLRLLEAFRKRGVPVDALGIQAHIGEADSGLAKSDEVEWRRFLDEVVAMDYDLLITEFDVNDKGVTGDTVARDAAIADYAQAYLDLMLSYPRMGDVLAWGMVDSYSWLQNLDPRSDGAAKRPTPYDASYRPKPLRNTISDALAAATPYRPSNPRGAR